MVPPALRQPLDQPRPEVEPYRLARVRRRSAAPRQRFLLRQLRSLVGAVVGITARRLRPGLTFLGLVLVVLLERVAGLLELAVESGLTHRVARSRSTLT